MFLRGIPDRWAELDRLAMLILQVLGDIGLLFDTKPYPTAAYRDNSPLMWEIRHDGIKL